MNISKTFWLPVTAASVICLHGCTYLQHRGRDLRDVVTISVEKNSYGASAQLIGPTLGLGFSEGDGYGLRSGAVGKYKHTELNIIIIGYKEMKLKPDPRAKSYADWSLWDPFKKDKLPVATEEEKEGSRASWFKTEAAIGLYYGLRVGFNYGEFLDFILGFTTLDILKDDVQVVEKSSRTLENIFPKELFPAQGEAHGHGRKTIP